MVSTVIFIAVVEEINFIYSAGLHHSSQSTFLCSQEVGPIMLRMMDYWLFLFLTLENGSFALQHIIQSFLNLFWMSPSSFFFKK